jgi:heme-degrading monooxygenase HmoA
LAVTLINVFEVPPGRVDEAVRLWDQAAAVLRRAPGFRTTRLHRGLGTGARFPLVNVAAWESEELWRAAISSEEFRVAAAPLMEEFSASPWLYEVIREFEAS